MITLDGKHQAIINDFERMRTKEIPKMKIEKKKLLNKKKESVDIEEKMDIDDRVQQINRSIQSHKEKEKNYFLSNAGILFDYFETKQQIIQGTNKTTILNQYFKTDDKSNSKLEEHNNISKFLTNVDSTYVDTKSFIVKRDNCVSCTVGEMIPVEYEGQMICNNCFCCVKYLVEVEKPSYKEPPKEVCFYAYKRINHFREILAQFQAKETTQIPNEVFQNIKIQIKKERISMEQLTNKKAKEILKKLGYNKYYEHVPFIKHKLGIKPPVMSSDLEATLCNLFMKIQEPYAKYCPDTRVNFLNYYYTIFKLCELLNQTSFLPFFPMLKDREKKMEQDNIWRNICNELDWKFIPTI